MAQILLFASDYKDTLNVLKKMILQNRYKESG